MIVRASGNEGMPLSVPAPHSRQFDRSVVATLTPVSPETSFESLVGEGACCAFQTPFWLAAWFSTMSCPSILGRYWLELRDSTGAPLLGMPLVLRQEASLRVLEGADLLLTDYNAPVIFQRAEASGLSPAAYWSALCNAIPQADVLRLHRMPTEIGGLANPLVEHRMARASRQSGWMAQLAPNWSGYFSSLTPSMRQKMNKAHRRFLREPGARFAMAASVAEGERWLAALEVMQSVRILGKGLDYSLDCPAASAFYRHLVRRGIESGQVAMAAMLCGEEVIAVSFATVSGERATYLRVANLFGRWHPMTPGQLVTKFLMESLHAHGVRQFDFALGDYEYKKRFGAKPVPLVDVEIATSIRGIPHCINGMIRGYLRRNPQLHRILSRKSDKPAHSLQSR
ncbi:COG5653 Protein involved in cellulose biosynthesis (CelD) [Rhabdaerophilaceae bacterium]